MSSDEKTTTELPAVPAWAIDLTTSVKSMRAELGAKVDELSGHVETLSYDAKDTRMRLGRIEREVDEVKNRQTDNSMRVKATSDENLTQDSAIALIATEVAGLKTTQGQQLAILQRLDAVAANPMVRRVAYAVALAILSYLASKGLVSR